MANSVTQSMAQLLVRLLGQTMVIQSQDQVLTDLAYQIGFPKTSVELLDQVRAATSMNDTTLPMNTGS